MDWMCSRCGKKIIRKEDYHSGLCFDCLKASVKPPTIPSEIDITACPICYRYKNRDRWVAPSSDDHNLAVTDMIIDAVGRLISDSREKLDFKVIPRIEEADSSLKSIVTVPVSIILRRELFDDKTVINQLSIKAHIHSGVCGNCSKISRGSYEAIVQIRVKGRKLEKNEADRILGFIDNRIRKISVFGKAQFITKIKETRFGVDLYFSSNNAAKKVSSDVVDEFGCMHKESNKLVGRNKSGKLTYRVVYSLRLPPFRLGDVFRTGGKYYLIENISGGRVYLLDIAQNQETAIPIAEAWRVDTVIPKETFNRFLIVAVEDTIVDLMNIETYETISVDKPAWEVKAGSEVVGFPQENKGFIIIPVSL